MSRKRQLFLHRENSHPHPPLALRRLVAWKNERRLRQVHLLRNQLHLLVAHSATVKKNRQRIPLEGPRRKTKPLRHPLPPPRLSKKTAREFPSRGLEENTSHCAMLSRRPALPITPPPLDEFPRHTKDA